jgi:hypothetical protein
VRDHKQLAYVCFEDEPGRRSEVKLLTRDEGLAWRGLGDGKIEGGHQSGAMFAAWRPFLPCRP